MIDFNRPAFTGREFDYIRDAGTERNALLGWIIYEKMFSVDDG